MRARRRPFRRTVAAVATFLHRALVPRVLPVVVLALLGPALLAGQAPPAQAATTLGAFGCMPVSDMSRPTINPPDELLAGRLRIPGYPMVRIGTGAIHWDADPLRDHGWRRQ